MEKWKCARVAKLRNYNQHMREILAVDEVCRGGAHKLNEKKKTLYLFRKYMDSLQHIIVPCNLNIDLLKFSNASQND